MKAEWGIVYPTPIARTFPGRDCASVFSSKNTEWKAWTEETERAQYISILAPRRPR